MPSWLESSGAALLAVETASSQTANLPSWLKSVGVPEDTDWRTLVVRLSLAAVAGLIVAGIYQLSQRRVGSVTISLVTTLVLLTILVAMTTIVIGDSVARAFGLVGALSIVRFRTVVDDTRDTSFVIFAVVVGMAIGAGHLEVCLVGISIVALAAFLMSRLQANDVVGGFDRRLAIRVSAGHDPETILQTAFRDQNIRWRLVSIVSARQGSAFDLDYQISLSESQSKLGLVKTLNSIDGVQSVELKDK